MSAIFIRHRICSHITQQSIQIFFALQCMFFQQNYVQYDQLLKLLEICHHRNLLFSFTQNNIKPLQNYNSKNALEQ